MRALKYILLLVVFFVPLLGPYSSFGYEKIKVLFFILSTSLIGFIWLFTKPQLKWDSIKIASLVFILVLFATSGLGLDFRSSFLGKDPYFQGLALYAYLFLFSLLVSSIKIKLDQVAMVLTGSAAVVSLVAIQDWILLNIFNKPIQTYVGRVVSTFGQPNFYAGFLLLALPFAGLLIKKRGIWRRLGIFAALGEFLGILISNSRAVIFLLFFGFLVIVLARYFRGRRFWAAAIVTVSLIIGVSFYFSRSFSTGFVWQELIEPGKLRNAAVSQPTDSVEKRFYIWPIAWDIASQNPILGSGLETIDTRFTMFFETNAHPSAVLLRLKDFSIESAHNYPLDLLIASGIAGFLSWGVLVFLMMRKIRSGVVFLGLASYLVWIQFQNQSVVHLVYFWLLVGLIDRSNGNRVLTRD